MKNKRMSILILLLTLLIAYGSIVSFGDSYNISAASAIVMDVKTGRILYEKNINDKKPMASTTKIMTALLALENGDPDKKIKVSKNAVGVEGSSIYLQKDEKVTMKDLVYGLMLRSGNDAAVAIACEVSGSVDNFAKLMNKRASQIGATNTNFVNPNGLHHKEHYTTAYDLALIAREALQNNDFKEIVKTKLWVADRDGYKYFYNKNKTLSQLTGGDGVKTGYTMAAGRCLVSSATRNGMQFVAVVLNDPNWFEDNYRLLNNAFEKYEGVTILKKDVPLKNMTVINGKKSSVGCISQEDVIIPLTKEEKSKIVSAVQIKEKIQAPIVRGQNMGKVQIFLDKKLLYTTVLFSREDIQKKGTKDKVMDFLKRLK